MAYCTQQQLVTEFSEAEIIQLTDDERLGVINTDKVAAAQAACDSDINKRLRMRGWTVPLVEITADITAIALDITRFYLFKNQEIEAVVNAYKRRIKELDDYVAGKIMLDIGTPNESTTRSASAGDVAFVTSERVFNPTSLAGF